MSDPTTPNLLFLFFRHTGNSLLTNILRSKSLAPAFSTSFIGSHQWQRNIRLELHSQSLTGICHKSFSALPYIL